MSTSDTKLHTYDVRLQISDHARRTVRVRAISAASARIQVGVLYEYIKIVNVKRSTYAR
jgi:hypothetical protein